jgi:hypothetical protein
MITERSLQCPVCHKGVKITTIPGMGICPIHGWVEIPFFEQERVLKGSSRSDRTEEAKTKVFW